MIAGPGVDLGIANPAVEAAGTPVLMLLSGRAVIHPATGAGELLGSPDAVGHLSNPLAAVHFRPQVSLGPPHSTRSNPKDLSKSLIRPETIG